MQAEESAESNEAGASTTLGAAVSIAGDGLLPVPAALGPGAIKAFSRLIGAAADRWVAKLEAEPARTRAYIAAEVQQIAATSSRIAEQIQVPAQYAEVAWRKHAANIVRQKTNIDNICRQARDELIEPWLNEEPSKHQAEVSDDWLNIFDSEAGNISTAQMQKLFGKILAGEIRRPGSFAIRTVKLLSELDNEAAELFVRICSLTTSLVTRDGRLVDVRALALGDRPSANGMAPYGLEFGNLNVLLEYGLINAEFNSQMPYQSCIAVNGFASARMQYLGKKYVLQPKIENQSAPDSLYEVGVSLTLAGRQLADIVEPLPNPGYTKALFEHFSGLGFTMTEL